MTADQKTELEYLIELVLESSKWKIEDGQDAIRLEVESRINSILSHEDQVVTGEPEISPVLTDDDFTALEAARLNEHLASTDKTEKKWQKQWKWKADKVRCQENGKSVWHRVSECHREKLFPNNPKSKKFRWVWDGPQDKQAQMDAMWEEHEASK